MERRIDFVSLVACRQRAPPIENRALSLADNGFGLELLERSRHLIIFDEEHVGTDGDVMFLDVGVESEKHLVRIGQGAFLLALLLERINE